MADEIEFKAWYDRFNRFAGDLYPGRYTADYVQDLVDIGKQVRELAGRKRSVIVAHNYQYPELQEVACEIGDSLGLSQYVAGRETPRVDFCGVWFMGKPLRRLLETERKCICLIGQDARWSLRSSTLGFGIG